MCVMWIFKNGSDDGSIGFCYNWSKIGTIVVNRRCVYSNFQTGERSVV